MIHCPPYVDSSFVMPNIDDTVVVYSLSSMLVCLMMTRIYLLLRLFSLYSKW